LKINLDQFKKEIVSCTRSLNQNFLDGLIKDLVEEIFDKEIVQDIDWKFACSKVRRTWKWMKLPPCAYFIEKFDEVKEHAKKDRKYFTVPCDICGGEGFLICLDDKDNETSIGCTCGNKPQSEKHTYMMLKQPERAWSFKGKFVFDKEWCPPAERYRTIEEWKKPAQEECPW